MLKKLKIKSADLLCDYFNRSTIHGVSYIAEKDRSWVERVCWISILCISVLFCGKLIFDASLINPIIIKFEEKPTPLWKLPFPAVTICPKTFARSINLTEIFLRQEVGADPFATFSDTRKKEVLAVSLYCAARHMLENLSNYSDCNECLDTVRKLRIPLHEIFVECKFAEQMINCAESFDELILGGSICYTFNGLGIYREDATRSSDWSIDNGYKATAPLDTLPRRALGAGPRYAFSVLLRFNKLDNDFLCSGPPGFMMEYRMPYETPQFITNFFNIRMEDSLTFMLKPKLMTTSKELQHYPASERKCYFSHEQPLKYFKEYTQTNCEVECAIDFVLHECNCLPAFIESEVTVCPDDHIDNFGFLDRGQIDVCGPSTRFCVGSTSSIIFGRKLDVCKCLPLCSSISYEAEFTAASLDSDNNSDSQFQYSQLTIYFKENHVMATQRSELYGRIDFLANCGGLMGLCLGMSMLSVMEIVYFCTIRLYDSLRSDSVHEHSRGQVPKRGLRAMLVDYSSKTTIQGICYVGDAKLSPVERVWWAVVIVVSGWCCGSMISGVFQRHEESPATISYANEETPVSKIPFPAVTVCPQVVSHLFMEMHYYFKVLNVSLYDLDQDSINAVTAVAQVCDPDILGDIDPRNVTHCDECGDYLKFFASKVNFAFRNCGHYRPGEDCYAMFKYIFLEEGMCYTYNTLDMYRWEGPALDVVEWTLEGGFKTQQRPWEVIPRAGSKESLHFTLGHIKLSNSGFCTNFTEGYKFFFHMPNEVPQTTKNFFVVPYKHYVQILINPKMTDSDAKVRDLPVGKRQCYFNDERYLRFFSSYTENNCEVECVVNRTLVECGCLMFYMPRIPGVKVCGISETRCHQRIAQQSVEQRIDENVVDYCDCLPSCTMITYDTEINRVRLADSDLKLVYHQEYEGISEVQIMFREEQFVAMKRSQLYETTALVANCGGLMGLFLGMSLISVLELAYFCTIRLVCNLKKHAFKKNARH